MTGEAASACLVPAGLNAPFGARCFVTLKEQMRDVADHIRS